MSSRLQELIDIEDLTELMGFFSEAAGLSVCVLDDEERSLVSLGWQEICRDFHNVNPDSRAKCLLSKLRAQQYLDSKKYLTYLCPNGLIELAFPILLDDRPIGYFFLGQFLLEPPDMDYFRRQAIAKGFPIEPYLQAVEKVPVVSKQRIDYLMRFFTRFFDLLTRIGAENKQRRVAEQETRRARDQLEERVAERTRELNKALLDVGDLAAQLSESLHQVEHLAVTDTLTENL